MKLDIQAIEHLAVLAKLSLATGEAEVYGRQLTDVLVHLDSLDEASKFIEKQQLTNKNVPGYHILPNGSNNIPLIDGW